MNNIHLQNTSNTDLIEGEYYFAAITHNGATGVASHYLGTLSSDMGNDGNGNVGIIANGQNIPKLGVRASNGTTIFQNPIIQLACYGEILSLDDLINLQNRAKTIIEKL